MFCKEKCSKWYGTDGLKEVHRNCKYKYSYSDSYEIHNFQSENFIFSLHIENNIIKYGDIYLKKEKDRSITEIDLTDFNIEIFNDLEKLDNKLKDFIIYE